MDNGKVLEYDSPSHLLEDPQSKFSDIVQTSFGVSLEDVLKSKTYTERGMDILPAAVMHASIEEGDENEEDMLGLAMGDENTEGEEMDGDGDGNEERPGE